MIDRSLNYGRQLIERFIGETDVERVVLDIGAGRGHDLAAASRLIPKAKLFAVECWPPFAQDLERRGIDVFRIDLEKDRLPLPNESVDIVIANQILEHTKEIFWIFHEVSRTLKTGGKFIIGVPNLASLHNRLLLLVGKQPSVIKSASAHVRGYTRQDLFDFVETCYPSGYALTRWGGSNFYPFPPVLAKPLATALPSLAWGMFLCLEKRLPYKDEFIRYPQERRIETNFFVGPLIENTVSG